jgi:hypothetical protein
MTFVEYLLCVAGVAACLAIGEYLLGLATFTIGLAGEIVAAFKAADTGRVIGDRRRTLDKVQREYDTAFRNLTLEEHGRPIEELLPSPEPPAPKLHVRPQSPSVAEYRRRWHDAEYQCLRDDADRNFRAMEPALRPATPADYEQWLRAFFARGAGNVRIDYVDRPMRTDRWYVATRHVTVRPLYGARSIHIIVPPGVRVNVPYERTGATGHSTLYLPDGSTRGFHNSPAYSIDVFTDTPVPGA